MEKYWHYKPTPQSQTDFEIVKKLQTDLTINESLATMLWQRGINSFEEAKHFFRPEIKDLHDPFLMKDMDVAVDRLLNAIHNNEKILVYGDYDVDGTTAVALFYGFLSMYYPNLETYNPDRYKEGYGVSIQGIDFAHAQGCSLIVCLDCGIKAHDKVLYAHEKYDIDFIICDHHEPDIDLPQAIAVLDPKRADCPYPFKELTGNGVGFKLLSAFCLKQNLDFKFLFEFIDLAMVSIASDIVPIVGENRILAYYGLKKINENPRTGLKALKAVAGFNGEMTIENVVFVLGPRINAAGRIKHARAAVSLLLSENYDEALEFAYEIQAHNNERKGLDSRITEEALQMIRENDWLMNQARSTVLFSPNWHKGVIGIVASRCIENFHRPTIIFTQSKENFAAGSARSVPGFDLYAALEKCAHLLEQFGGHTHAAGMTIELEKIDLFRKVFDEVVNANILPEHLIPKITIDLKVPLSEISPKFNRIMKQMAPFGPQNMQPVFVSENLKLVSSPRIMKEKHLRLEVTDADSGVVFTAVGFGMAEEFGPKLTSADSFSMVYSLEENNFRDKTTLQLFARDFKFI